MENFLPGTEITLATALLAEDGETALFAAGDEAFLFWNSIKDFVAPSISNITQSSAEINQPLTISAKIMDNAIVNTATLKYRKGGDNSFNSLTMNATGLNDLYEAVIPGSNVTVTNVEFYILARDAAGNQHTSEHKMSQITVPAGNLSIPAYHGGGEQNAYRMISIPLFLENPQSMFAQLLPYDASKWRASHDNGTVLREYTQGIGDLEPGRAFWFISINDVNWNPGDGTTQGLFSFASINLHPGWNQIGNPLNYTVSWQDILNQSGSPNISGPYLYEGSYAIKTTIEPFKGYYINNQTGANFNLEIPLNGAGAAVTKPVGTNNGWQVSIVASIDQAEDRLNIIGIEEDAKEEWDRCDYPEPPPIGKYLSLYFPHYEWKEHPGRYAVDIRKNSDKGFIWDFEVETNIRRGQVHLSFKELQEIANSGKIPAEFQIILIEISV